MVGEARVDGSVSETPEETRMGAMKTYPAILKSGECVKPGCRDNWGFDGGEMSSEVEVSNDRMSEVQRPSQNC